ncbi:hypothetical protein [Stenotrophomonas sp. Marseille-Q4652]|jgi:DNA-binding transcriptional LysR family regulator|uniref:hypothetical protein n=1 Tax=Stenotrophomonas sp. Marseille-Q4652 TaxID=2866595 RepID=UPI001CE40039|nr:hypothetical protein [Stenotrophomonas sp. Marseille-Q4652]
MTFRVVESYSAASAGNEVLLVRDTSLIAKRIGPIYGKLVASPEYMRRHGAPETPDEILAHEALMLGTEAWQFQD